jgi:hypothetical protein
MLLETVGYESEYLKEKDTSISHLKEELASTESMRCIALLRGIQQKAKREQYTKLEEVVAELMKRIDKNLKMMFLHRYYMSIWLVKAAQILWYKKMVFSIYYDKKATAEQKSRLAEKNEYEKGYGKQRANLLNRVRSTLIRSSHPFTTDDLIKCRHRAKNSELFLDPHVLALDEKLSESPLLFFTITQIHRQLISDYFNENMLGKSRMSVAGVLDSTCRKIVSSLFYSRLYNIYPTQNRHKTPDRTSVAYTNAVDTLKIQAGKHFQRNFLEKLLEIEPATEKLANSRDFQVSLSIYSVFLIRSVDYFNALHCSCHQAFEKESEKKDTEELSAFMSNATKRLYSSKFTINIYEEVVSQFQPAKEQPWDNIAIYQFLEVIQNHIVLTQVPHTIRALQAK